MTIVTIYYSKSLSLFLYVYVYIYIFKGCRPCRRPRNKQPRLADLLGVSHHFEWAIFRLSNNLICLPSVIIYLENCRPKQPLLLLLLTEE